MKILILNNRQYRTDGRKSKISGRLIMVEYQNDFGVWKNVKNVSRRDEILNMFESA